MSRIQRTNLFLLAVESSCGKCESNGKKHNDLPGIPGVSRENILFLLIQYSMRFVDTSSTFIRKLSLYDFYIKIRHVITFTMTSINCIAQCNN